MSKKIPLILLFLVFLLGELPDMFLTIPGLPTFISDGVPIGLGVLAVDVVLLIMLIVILSKYINDKTQRIGLGGWTLAFMLLLVFDVMKNVPIYHLSALGEIRTRYFFLIIPCYIAYTFDTKKMQEDLSKMLLFISITVPFILIPVIGIIKGWSFGPSSRFMTAQTYLGSIYGITYLFLSRKYIKKKKMLAYLTMSLVLIIMLVIDSHRSVWLAAIVIIILLFAYEEIRFVKNIHLIILLSGVILTIFLILGENSFFFVNEIAQRGSAIISPLSDDTASWRIYLWQAQIEKFFRDPIFGEGFGAYWYSYVPQLGVVTVSPHSYYIQSLVKIGLVGLLLYITIYIKIFLKLKSFLKKYLQSWDRSIVLLTILVLISSHVFYVVYSLEYYSMFYLGLGLAVLKSNKIN